MKTDWQKYRREVVEFAAGEFDFKVERIQDWHLRLTNQFGKQLDFFPKSRRATWVGTNRWFIIEDIETFIPKTFLTCEK
jgi:hypothetical protein